MKNRIKVYAQLERYAQQFAIARDIPKRVGIDTMAKEFVEHRSPRNLRNYMVYYQHRKAEETLK